MPCTQNTMEITLSGKLVLVPTPIDEETPLDTFSIDLLKENLEKYPGKTIIAIEDLKPGRRRWLRWGLPRETIEDFCLFNEHTQKELSPALIREIQAGKNVFLMSDGGLPAFCDPGLELVSLCHQYDLRVTSTPFYNSPILALALSGLAHREFLFKGFLPVKEPFRAEAFDELMTYKMTTIIMDTPYRLKKTLEEVRKRDPKKVVCLALSLGAHNEWVKRGAISEIIKKIPREKEEFILILQSR